MANHTALEQARPDWLSRDALLEAFVNVLTFVAIMLAAYLLGRGLRYLYDHSHRKRMTSAQVLFGKIMVVSVVTFGFFVALGLVYRVEPLSLVATLGVASLALGFGLQNTVANMAAGIGLAVDKPFDVGDRIQIGETWGDVLTVGLRSTRIMTVNGDLVVVPNSMLDTRELWNFTYGGNPRYRLDLPVGVSYESSIPLAESLLLEAARAEDGVLDYPEPVVRVMGFGNSSIDLQLRVWISQARARPAVRDRLLRDVKRRFDEDGVIFPFPQHTISRHENLPEAAPTPPFLLGEASQKPVILVVTRGRESARAMAAGIVDVVRRLDGRMVVLHVRKPTYAMSIQDGQGALNIYLNEAHKAGVTAKAETEVGDLPKVLRQVVREENAKLVLFGRPQTRAMGVGWIRSEVAAARQQSPVPLLTVGSHGEIPDEWIETWRKHLHPPPPEEEPDEAAPVEETRAELEGDGDEAEVHPDERAP